MGLDRKLVEVRLQIYEDLYTKLAEMGDIGHHVNVALEKYLGGALAGYRTRTTFEEFWGE
ncbi:MAG: hypothetical protein QXT33_02405 [Thermofilum sp.]|uniref:Uncharacterized protein n=1 Tax=Thermofilum pendens TaxID=2269 RepID=A0A7C4H3P6_THEPE